MSSLVATWCERNGLRLKERTIERPDGAPGESRVGRLTMNGNIELGDHGDLVLQGEPVELDDDWLIVKGTRHAWDQGPIQFQGRFAVRMGARLDIDGPLP